MAKNSIRYAGDFYIEEIQLLTIKGGSIDLKDIISTIDIYEDIGTHAITGSISFVDTNNIVYNGPIIGQERLYLKVYTPQDSPTDETVIDFTKNTLYINRIISVTDLNDQTKVVTLSFTTQDIYMNSRVRVSKSYTGEPSAIIKKILRSPTLLDSKKKLFFEETSNNYKFVVGNMRPFSAINMIAQRSLSSTHGLAPSYLFFETSFGYHFRSVDSLFDQPNVKAIFREHNPTILNEKSEKNYQADMENLRQLSVTNAQDSFLNTRMGMYSSNIIIYDWYSKSIKKKKFNYLDDFAKDKHAQQNAAEGSPNPLISEAKEFGDKRLSDFPDSILFVQGTILDGIVDKNYYELEGATHADYKNPYEGNNVDKWCMRRRSRLAQLESGTTLQVEVVGRTNIQAGDIVEVEVPSSSTVTTDNHNKYLSGRYLIKQLHHSFSTKGGDSVHVCQMTLVKDDVREAYPSAGTGPGGSAWTDAGDSANQAV
jgi:hypothetical protein